MQISIEMSEKDKPHMGPLPPARQGKPHEAGFESNEGEDKEKMEPDSTRPTKGRRFRPGISLIFLCLLLVGPPLYMLYMYLHHKSTVFIPGVIALVISLAVLALILSGRLGTNGGNGGGGGGGCGGGGCGGGN